MLFEEAIRSARAVSYAFTGSGAIPATRAAGPRALPGILEPPTFRPRSRPASQDSGWIERGRSQMTRWVLAAAVIASLAVIVSTTVPALASLRSTDSEAVALSSYASSAGVTGSAATRVEDLSATTFVGGIPFVQQLNYFTAVSRSAPEASQFVSGARQASIGQYVQDVSADITLPYVNGIAADRQAAVAWSQAIEENERQSAVQAAVSAGPAWQAPPITNGTRIAGATVTFYACIGNGFCGNMASGQAPFEGAAACSADMPFGTRFTVANDPTGRVFVCLDRGALASPWVDVWFYDAADGWAWQSYVGTVSDIIIQ